MKVYIGPYEKEVVPFRKWARNCKQEFISDRLYDLANFLKPVNTLHKKRKVKVHIDKYDVWGLDETLAFIIVPTLQLLKKQKQGAPHVDDEDVPKHLRLTEGTEWDTDSNHFARWEYVLDEMIWAFEQYTYEDDAQFHHNFDNLEIKFPIENGLSKLEIGPKDPSKPPYYFDNGAYAIHQARKANGRRLFAKYYDGLWD